MSNSARAAKNFDFEFIFIAADRLFGMRLYCMGTLGRHNSLADIF